MCNRARLASDPETLHTRFDADWADDAFRPNAPLHELYPRANAHVVRRAGRARVLDAMRWGVLPAQGGGGNPGTNVRNLGAAAWRGLVADPSQRCLVPLTEFCEWTPGTHAVGGGRAIKGEMWFAVADQPVFAVAGFWRTVEGARGFAMVTCAPNELVAPIHPKAMIVILAESDWDAWLFGDAGTVAALQRPYPADRMTVRGPVFPTRGDAKHAPAASDD